VYLRKQVVAFETLCVYSVVYVYLRFFFFFYLLVMCLTFIMQCLLFTQKTEVPTQQLLSNMKFNCDCYFSHVLMCYLMMLSVTKII